MQTKFKTDWLATKPVYYNERTKCVSHNINDVIEFRNLEFDKEGLRDYIEYGYSVYGHTPIKNVKFLNPNCQIEILENKLSFTKETDIAESFKNRQTTPSELIEQLQETISRWEAKDQNLKIVPLSGGYDSRLLLSMMHDKQNTATYTYGIAPKQSMSFEVTYAQELSNRLGFDWQQIELGNFHDELSRWDDLFGISIHAHGMYHLEFYRAIRKIHERPMTVVSGIFGDVWAGNVGFRAARSAEDLPKISYNHGLKAQSESLHHKCGNHHRDAYWEQVKEKVNDPFFQTIHIIRQKMILIQYLLAVPRSLGFNVWSPFLKPEIALGMLSLPQAERINRIWQTDYFKKTNLSINSPPLFRNTANTLYSQACKQVALQPLNINLLKELFDPNYIEWINRKIRKDSPYDKLILALTGSPIPRAGDALKRLKLDAKWQAYNAYMTIKPVENVLKKRNKS